jgi:CheY-like chemotaxis protein
MLSVPLPVLNAAPRLRTRTALVASADRSFRQRIAEILTGLRWKVREAEGGAEAWAATEAAPPEAMIVDSWFPDLDLAEFLRDFRSSFPQVDLVTAGSFPVEESPRGPYRQELLYALRRCQDTDTAAWNAAPPLSWPSPAEGPTPGQADAQPTQREDAGLAATEPSPLGTGTDARPAPGPVRVEAPVPAAPQTATGRLPELVGNAPCMLEVSRRIRLVAHARRRC